MQHYWFGDVENDSCTMAQGDAKTLAERLDLFSINMKSFVPLAWEQAQECGFVRDRPDYIARLRELCMIKAEEKIASYYAQSDIELLQMVRMLDEIDNVINLLMERATEWYQVRNPGFTRKYRALNAKKMLTIIKKDRLPSLHRLTLEIESLSKERTRLMQEVSKRADRVAPNCSALVGGLVAARLISRAGGLEQLARLPASTIQVLGAENALFTHLRSGTPSPKHGIIFQHRRVHNASKNTRGRVARVLAAKLGIAARLDFYRGELVPGFLEEAQKKIDEAGVKT
jgi:nucleolar protein 56